MQLAAPGQELVKNCLEKGLVINCTQDTVLRFVPPLIIDRNDVDRCIQILSEVLDVGRVTPRGGREKSP
jgi:4-aminobutyrate aminotransferase-like enzyme